METENEGRFYFGSSTGRCWSLPPSPPLPFFPPFLSSFSFSGSTKQETQAAADIFPLFSSPLFSPLFFFFFLFFFLTTKAEGKTTLLRLLPVSRPVRMASSFFPLFPFFSPLSLKKLRDVFTNLDARDNIASDLKSRWCPFFFFFFFFFFPPPPPPSQERWH